MLTRPCKGKLSDETHRLLRTCQDKADWRLYPCEVCGQSVGIVEEKGHWVPERHWPSVIYTPRKPGGAGRYHKNASCTE